MATYTPAYLTIGTEVSAKYRGAFCEAKVKKAIKSVKIRVSGKDSQTSVWITDDQIVTGAMKVGSVVEYKQAESGQVMEGVVNKVNDNSTYTVVFDDGDERTLRRNQLCLKGDKHFDVSETLDNLPLSHPEHFGTPVLKSKKTARSRTGESDSEKDDSSSEDDSPKRASYKNRHQELVGKVMLAEVADKRKGGAPTPVLVVLPDAHPVELKNRDQLLVRSFRDTKFMAVNRKDLKEFSREAAIKNEDKALKAAFEKGLLYYDSCELPSNWNREELLGPDDGEGDVGDESSDDEEQCEERDRFVAQLYKFMDDRGTPINKGPCIGNKDLNLYRLFRVVQNIGGYNKATNQMKWRLVYSKMGLPPSNTAAHQIKNAYKKYLHAFEDFYRKLGCIMGTISRPGRQSRQTSSRGILSFRSRDKESSPRSPRTEKAAVKEEKSKEDEKAKGKPEESSVVEEREEVREPTPSEEADDTVRRSTPRREKAQNQKEESKTDKKEELKVRKEEEKKEEAPKEEKKKEEKREERKSLRQSQKEKEEDKKDATKTKEEEKKEVKKEEGKTDRVLRKDLNDKEEEEKKEPEDPKEAQKKRVTRRKLARVEEDKKEGDEKEEEEEKADDKKEKKKSPTSAKKEKTAPKKKAEEEENETKDKESENESEDESSSNVSQDQEVLSVGTRLKVRYGRGRNHKIYEAKVIEFRNNDPHKKYRVHYAGWNNRYDEWVETERIVKVVDRPELTKLKKKPLTAKSLKASPVQAAIKNEIPFIKKRGRQPSTQQVPSPGGTSSKPSPAPAVSEAKPPKTKASGAPTSAASKTRSMRSNSTEIKPETTSTSTAKQRITRRSSGINESTDEPVTGDMEEGNESDMELETGPVGPGEADNNSEHPEEEEAKESVQDTRMEEKEEILPLVESSVELKPTIPQEEDFDTVKMDDSKLKRLDTDNESLSPITSVVETDSAKEVEPLPPPPPSQPLSAPDENVSLKDSSTVIQDTAKLPEVVEPVLSPAKEEVKEEQKMEDSAPQLVSAKEEGTVKEETKAEEEKEKAVEPSCVETPAVNKQEAEKPAPLHDPTIPQLKKIELDPPPVVDKKEGKEKERLKQGKKLGRDFKKNRQSEMRTSFSEIPTLEPMTMPREVKPAPVDVKPSPYDFNDTEADSPSPWQPEITKKWEPSNRALPFFRDVKMEQKKSLSLETEKKSLETEKKKVKKKNKKTVDEQSGESESPSPTKPSEKKTKDPFVVKKGRRKRTADGEVKVDTSSYEETVNSVVESCKNDDLASCLPVPPLLETKEEKPTKKRKKMFQCSAAQESEAVQEGKKEPAKPVKALKGKVGRKKKEVKTPEIVTDQNANPTPLLVPPPDVHIPSSSSSHHEKQPSTEPYELSPVKPLCSEGGLPSASLPSSCVQGLVVPAPMAGPSGLQILSMASIRPVPSTSGAAGAGPSDRLAPLLEGVRCEVVKQVGLEPPRVDCAGDMPKAACPVGNTVLDNTPPTTPENDLDEANSASSSSDGHDNLKEDLDSLDSVERTCKGGSESPPGCDFSLSSTSSENLPSSSSGAQSNGPPSQSSETGTTKRKKKDDTGAAPVKKKRRLVSRSTRERNKKSPKYGDDDSQSRSPVHQNNSDSGLVSAGNNDAIKSGVPRQPKFHFADDLGEHLQGEQRIQFLLDKMKEIRRVYQSIKARAAAIDRKRKRARRMEKERESSQASTGDKETS